MKLIPFHGSIPSVGHLVAFKSFDKDITAEDVDVGDVFPWVCGCKVLICGKLTTDWKFSKLIHDLVPEGTMVDEDNKTIDSTVEPIREGESSELGAPGLHLFILNSEDCDQLHLQDVKEGITREEILMPKIEGKANIAPIPEDKRPREIKEPLSWERVPNLPWGDKALPETGHIGRYGLWPFRMTNGLPIKGTPMAKQVQQAREARHKAFLENQSAGSESSN